MLSLECKAHFMSIGYVVISYSSINNRPRRSLTLSHSTREYISTRSGHIFLEMVIESWLRHSAIIGDLGYGYLVDTLMCCKFLKGLGKYLFCGLSLQWVHRLFVEILLL